MPNYGTVKKFCKLRQKEALFPETFVSAIGGAGKLMRHIEDCLSKDEECARFDCKYTGKGRDPFQSK